VTRKPLTPSSICQTPAAFVNASWLILNTEIHWSMRMFLSLFLMTTAINTSTPGMTYGLTALTVAIWSIPVLFVIWRWVKVVALAGCRPVLVF
jgi:hypothetical protein